jgi:hypothetical protein
MVPQADGWMELCREEKWGFAFGLAVWVRNLMLSRAYPLSECVPQVFGALFKDKTL